jgi:sugar lactone lactonase YvrE
VIDFRPLDHPRCLLGEGPAYDARRKALWFCDIESRALHCVGFGDERPRQWTFPSEVCSLGIAESGRLVIALRDSVGLFDPEREDWRAIATVTGVRAETRLNDGKVGPDGAFWVGSMDERTDKQPIGILYRVTADGRVEAKADGIKVSNGLAFSADGRTMFHADSRGPWIDRWDFDPATGAVGNRQRIATLDDAGGRPDGGATDVEGAYWSAGVSAQHLNRFDRDGRLLARIPVPVAAPTMPCFGGADMRTLFVTNLTKGRPAELVARFPLSGLTVFGRSPVAGAPVTLFAD